MSFNEKTAVALGTFDGLHKGHMSVITCALSYKERGFIPLVMLFDSHPLISLTGNAPAEILQTELRNEIIENCGAQSVTVPFDEIKNLSCREFFEEIIVKKLNAGAVCCGGNYRFGKGGEGDCKELQALCDEFSVELTVSPEISFDGSPVSSTRIRKAIENGDIPLANAMLGREFRYKYEVVSGDKRGRLMGAPTINQHFSENFVIPKNGVYASVTAVDGKEYSSVTNIGMRPSFGNTDLRSETCILGFSGDLYGKFIEVRLLKYIRGEIKFDSMEALSEQIRKDTEASLKVRGESSNV